MKLVISVVIPFLSECSVRACPPGLLRLDRESELGEVFSRGSALSTITGRPEPGENFAQYAWTGGCLLVGWIGSVRARKPRGPSREMGRAAREAGCDPPRQSTPPRGP